MRKNTVFQTGDKNAVKLQPFGGMHSHQLHGVLAGFGLVVAGFQRGVRQKGDQRRQRFTGVAVRHQQPGQGLVQHGRRWLQALTGRRLRQRGLGLRRQLVNRQRHGISAKAFLTDK